MIIKKIFQLWMLLSPMPLCVTIYVLLSLGRSNVPFDAYEALDAISWTIFAYCGITLAVLIAMMAQTAKEIRMERKIKGDKNNGNEEEHHAR